MPLNAFDLGYIAAAWTETALWGAYLVLYALCVYILFARSGQTGNGRIPRPVLGSITAMAVFSTAHASIGLSRLLTGLNNGGGDTVPGTLAVFRGAGTWINILKEAVYTSNIVTADGLLAWRMWTIWGRQYRVVILPIFLLLCTAGCGLGSCVAFALAQPNASFGEQLFARELNGWVRGFFACTLATNAVCTSAIAYRILAFLPEPGVRGVVARRAYVRLAAAVIESGVIYSGTMLALLVLWLAGFDIEFLLVDATMPIACIVPTLIVIRVGLGVQWQTTHLVPGHAVESIGFSFGVLTTSPNVIESKSRQEDFPTSDI